MNISTGYSAMNSDCTKSCSCSGQNLYDCIASQCAQNELCTMNEEGEHYCKNPKPSTIDYADVFNDIFMH